MKLRCNLPSTQRNAGRAVKRVFVSGYVCFERTRRRRVRDRASLAIRFGKVEPFATVALTPRLPKLIELQFVDQAVEDDAVDALKNQGLRESAAVDVGEGVDAEAFVRNHGRNAALMPSTLPPCVTTVTPR